MKAIFLSNAAASYVLKHVPLLPAAIYESMSPLSFPSMLSSHIAAPALPVDNPVYTQYLSFWASDQLRGIEQWVSVLHLLRTRFPQLSVFNSWPTFRAAIATVLPASILVDQFQIPTLFIADDSTVHFRSMGLTEYLRFHDITPDTFMIHVLQIVLFGFVVNHQTISAFRADNEILGYVTFRIEQGDFDRRLRPSISMTSEFDPTTRPSNNPAYLKIAEAVTPFLEKRKLFPSLSFPAPVKREIQGVHSLGPTTYSIKKLARLGIFNSFDRRYNDYLRRRLPRNTEAYGESAFFNRTHAYEIALRPSQYTSRYEQPIEF